LPEKPNTLHGQNTKRLNVEADGTVLVHTAAGLLKPVIAFFYKRQSPLVGQVAVCISVKQPWRGLSEVTSPHDVILIRTHAQNIRSILSVPSEGKGFESWLARRLPSTFTAVITKRQGQTVPRTNLAVTTFS
jgi:hypothetical protein